MNKKQPEPIDPNDPTLDPFARQLVSGMEGWEQHFFLEVNAAHYHFISMNLNICAGNIIRTKSETVNHMSRELLRALVDTVSADRAYLAPRDFNDGIDSVLTV